MKTIQVASQMKLNKRHQKNDISTVSNCLYQSARGASFNIVLCDMSDQTRLDPDQLAGHLNRHQLWMVSSATTSQPGAGFTDIYCGATKNCVRMVVCFSVIF